MTGTRSLFGAAGPPDGFVEHVERIGNMDGEALEGIALSVPELVKSDMDSAAASVAARLRVRPSQVVNVLQVVTLLAHCSEFNNVPMMAASSELEAWGLSAEARDKLDIVLEALLPHVSVLERKRRRVVAERTALASLKSLEVLCDLRAVYALEIVEDDSLREEESLRVAEWAPMALVELVTELNGEQKTVSFQADHRVVEHIRRVMEVTLQRLANLSPPRRDAEGE